MAVTDWDYRKSRRIGARRFNHCYVKLERDETGMRRHRFVIRQAAGLSTCGWIGRFSAWSCIRGMPLPMLRGGRWRSSRDLRKRCFNHPDWGLKRLMPEETFSGRYTITHRWERTASSSGE